MQNGEFSLQIENAGPQDAGDYICQIATLEPLEITHTVEILGESFIRKVLSVTSINLFFNISPATNTSHKFWFTFTNQKGGCR